MPQRRNLHETCTKGLVALGGNVDFAGSSPARTLARALAVLDCPEIRITRISRFYSTPCMPAGAGPDFINAVAAIETTLPAAAMLERLHRVEARFGRRRQARWAARTLDLDLLDLGGAILPDRATQDAWRDLSAAVQARLAPPRLILPHPRLQDRAFVLVPLAEIAPDWHHPILGLTAKQMLDALPRDEKLSISAVLGPWAGLSALVKAFDNQ
ncbi:2-amino-4-hydroxy-6-hydroxymethyldihydropteridine diphosphokinase [Rhodovulum bhavnagarense]|uniref:2-amino-4-hydroxy-6-hydroxymethyldihydropteridine pyrophosphokinase n=1 Tax=Rhodovulum bhavnagarense TaxID=992286 RepID=A0A4R2R9V8_9RHOB|nr:2-amino-4-hydroxy-6-hydroxymethyldihydropteridine diphosphokinase [Rhodovulum bhavnagarense]TCP60032.1 2-amino-4-hydroxy-6-hydroxymethyldihydropteridine diphosphokinase [Rhodovulum bhavnagarense]